MRRSKRELQARWMARAAASATADQALRDGLNPRNARRGAPFGNTNRLTHGLYTGERLMFDRESRALATLSRMLLALSRLPSPSRQKIQIAQRLGDKLNSTFGVAQ